MRLEYFHISEFDSPDEPGSGAGMSRKFLRMLDEARGIANVPFVITSGFRTPQHQKTLQARGYKTSDTSSHLIGVAADISCTTSAKRYRILAALIAVGFTRIGIADTFIHVDNDATKTPGVAWTYA
jgi:zinc D-Ala-D-Ala carboxypeptidase